MTLAAEGADRRGLWEAADCAKSPVLLLLLLLWLAKALTAAGAAGKGPSLSWGRHLAPRGGRVVVSKSSSQLGRRWARQQVFSRLRLLIAQSAERGWRPL